jgi:hypothetical protein
MSPSPFDMADVGAVVAESYVEFEVDADIVHLFLTLQVESWEKEKVKSEC